MFELDFEMLKEQGLQLVDDAKKIAEDWTAKGKNQIDLLNQQARLSKAQRQLGALVYSLHKSGEENQPLMEKYINAIAEIEQNIENLKKSMTAEECAEVEAVEEEFTAAEETAAPAKEETAEDEEDEEVPIDLRGETKTCPVCGSKVDGDAQFCNHCGASVEDVE